MSQQTLEVDTTALVNQTINDFFERSIIQAARVDSSYSQLWETLYGLIRSGGKRLRPKITLLAYEAFGGKDSSAIIPVAAAQELLHFCLLIHDDIIDRDYVRYGTPNIAGRYQISYKKFIDNSAERTHYAHGAAILGGDLMLSGAYQLIILSDLSNEDKCTAQVLLSESIFEVAGGELLDTESSFTPYEPGDALKIAEYKTASYSFITPLLTGARLAGANPERVKSLRNFGLALGIAYQLVDDILGVFGDENETGKSTSGDIREGKKTYMVEQAMATMSKVEKSIFERAFANPSATPDEISTARNLLVSCGAKKRSEQAVAHYAQAARNALQELSLSEHYQEKFEDLIQKVTERTF